MYYAFYVVGSGSKFPPSLKLKGSWFAKEQKKGSLVYKNAKARCSHGSQGRDTPAKGSSSAVKLAIPMVASSLKGRKCAVSSALVAEGDGNRVKSKLFNEGLWHGSVLVVTNTVLVHVCIHVAPLYILINYQSAIINVLNNSAVITWLGMMLL